MLAAMTGIQLLTERSREQKMDHVLKPGRYRHYKGKDYIVLGVARHSETEEKLVVYRTDYGDRGLWVRPEMMFKETVEIDGQMVPRFRFVEEDATP